MIIFRELEKIREKLANPVVTIGNFDGVHLGHREIFRRVNDAAAAVDGVSVVITFTPHPLKLFPSQKIVKLITPYAEKEALIEASGIDYLLVIPFTKKFAGLTASEFVADILVNLIGVKKLIIGYDYAFGRNREGNVDLLNELGNRYGFEVEALGPIGEGGTIYSSTRIREMIGRGNVGEVVSLLGRHFSFAGTVVHGHHRGKKLGFPTANLVVENDLVPGSGVYAVKVQVHNDIYDGACNIGSNPTFENVSNTIEVFIFNIAEDLYGRRLRLFFIERIRDEQKFADANSLQQAIRHDVMRCQDILRATSIIEYHEAPLVVK